MKSKRVLWLVAAYVCAAAIILAWVYSVVFTSIADQWPSHIDSVILYACPAAIPLGLLCLGIYVWPALSPSRVRAFPWSWATALPPLAFLLLAALPHVMLVWLEVSGEFIERRADRQSALCRFYKREWVAASIQESLRQDLAPFELMHLKALTYDPQKQFLVRELAEEDAERRFGRFSDPLAQEAYRIYTEYRAIRGNSVSPTEWSQCDDFLDCRIFLYGWDSQPDFHAAKHPERPFYIFVIFAIILSSAAEHRA
jgi:hypothetical protein